MKKNVSSLLLMACILLLLLCSCSKKSGGDSVPQTFQGPMDPSFEGAVDYNSDGARWTTGTVDDYYFSFITRPTGTGFMPTKGNTYLKMGSSWINGEIVYNRVEQVYQNNVSFNSSTKLIFDYSLQGNGVAQILFTANGTATLWTSSTNVGGANIQKTNETVTLPSLPDSGKLIIQFSTMSVNTSFQIDNIRVQ